jgi:hypothetical protein
MRILAETLWKLAMKTNTSLVMVLMPLMLIPKYMTVVKERKVRRLVLLPIKPSKMQVK